MIGIVVALRSEAASLLTKFNNLKELLIADKPAFCGKLCGKDVILAISGIGKVSAALTTQLIIDKYSPDFILNFGTCGGMNNSVKIKNYYAIEKCCQYDFDLRELDGVPLGYIQEYNTAFFENCLDGTEHLSKSILASADRFTNKECDISTINEIGCSLCDMEGGAIAQVCTSNKVPLIMVKGITDVQGSGTAPEQFMNNLKAVSEGFPTIIMQTLESVYKAKNI